jgi:hypothetical protein
LNPTASSREADACAKVSSEEPKIKSPASRRIEVRRFAVPMEASLTQAEGVLNSRTMVVEDIMERAG